MNELQARCAPRERLRSESDDAAMVKAAMDVVGLTAQARRRLETTLERLDLRDETVAGP